MILSALLGTLVGVYGAYMIRFFYKNKKSKHLAYIRFLIVISISVLGPLAVYIIRIFEGVGVDGDPPESMMMIFGVSLLGWLFGLLFIFNKNNELD